MAEDQHKELLKARIDLHDLAQRLGLERPGGHSGNYRSPDGEDKNPSLSIFRAPDGALAWNDFKADLGGDCFALVMHVRGGEFIEAVRYLEDTYAMPRPRADQPAASTPETTEEWIAKKCLEKAELAIPFLTDERKLPEHIVRRAIQARSLGFNDWCNPKKSYGEFSYGGPAATFIVRTMNPGKVVAIDHRFIDPAGNGNVKTKTKGEKDGYPWFSHLPALKAAHTVFICESSINALTIEAAELPGTAALALRGTGNVQKIDWTFLRGKHVIAVMDYDRPDEHGKCPGQAAMWALHECLLGRDVTCQSIDQADWPARGINDINDLLQSEGVEGVALALRRLEPWLIPGRPGKLDLEMGRSRVFLPAHDAANYWRFRVRPDFTTFVKEWKDDADTGTEQLQFTDVCGFRIAGLSRVTIASATSATTGELDNQPTTVFSASVQLPRHGATLTRRVFRDDTLHNVEIWRKFGPIWATAQFSRMLSILERTVHIAAREAVNFVGLAWKDGRPVVNEGPDCYFTEPEKQCPYHNLLFPSGPITDARPVIDAYQQTFKHNAALQVLVWALGAHLKAFLGFWPHLQMQAKKGAGKTTFAKRMERTIGYTLFGTEQIKTEYRQLTVLSATSQPVGWEEISQIPQRYIDSAMTALQQAYNFLPTTRGSEMTQYLLSAPVLLAGEDVPMRGIIGKMVRTDLRDQGPQLALDLPPFPVREWLQFLTTLTRQQVLALHAACEQELPVLSRDAGGRRMAGNYAAVLVAWRLLAKFAGIATETGHFEADLQATMNKHIMETEADREPWVWIMETTLNQIDRGEYRSPLLFEHIDDGKGHIALCLCIKHTHIIDHLRHTPALRQTFDALPIKTPAVFRHQLSDAGLIHHPNIERTINARRCPHLLALSLDALERYGLSVSVPISPSSQYAS